MVYITIGIFLLVSIMIVSIVSLKSDKNYKPTCYKCKNKVSMGTTKVVASKMMAYHYCENCR